MSVKVFEKTCSVSFNTTFVMQHLSKYAVCNNRDFKFMFDIRKGTLF